METQPPNEVNVSLEEAEPPEGSALRELAPRCERFCRAVLDRLGIRGWELSVLLCGDRFIQTLNARYRGIDRPTDVLSFAQDEGAEDGAGPTRPPGPKRAAPVRGGGGAGGALRPVGDIVLSLETARRNAAGEGIPEEEELKKLLVHGILHLAGMDHPEGEGGEDAAGSRRLQPAKRAGAMRAEGGEEAARRRAARPGDMLALQEKLIAELREEK